MIWLFSSSILSALGRGLVENDPLQKAEAALVLDGDGSGNRILKAAELVRQGYAPVAIISGANPTYGVHSCDLAIPFAVRHGYPEAYFEHLESDALSTETEAAVALQVIRRRGLHRILLVTSDYHTRRAAQIYRAQAPEITFIVVAAPDEHFSPNGWWRDRQGRKVFLLEAEKTVAHWLSM